MSPNVITVTTNRTGMIQSSLPMMYLIISTSQPLPVLASASPRLS